MESGSLRKLLTLQSCGNAQNAFGEDASQAWTDLATLWGSIRNLNGRELALAKASTITATATHQVRIRYRPGLLITMRIVYAQGGPTQPRYFAINAIADDEERHRELILTCTEIKA